MVGTLRHGSFNHGLIMVWSIHYGTGTVREGNRSTVRWHRWNVVRHVNLMTNMVQHKSQANGTAWCGMDRYVTVRHEMQIGENEVEPTEWCGTIMIWYGIWHGSVRKVGTERHRTMPDGMVWKS